jgi:hypothetical protein
MYLQGKIIQIFDEQSGESSNGKWRKREFVMETFAKIPRKVCLSVRGEGVAQFRYNVGDAIQSSIDIESREHNGRYYTEVRAWKIEPYSKQHEENLSESEEESPF